MYICKRLRDYVLTGKGCWNTFVGKKIYEEPASPICFRAAMYFHPGRLQETLSPGILRVAVKEDSYLKCDETYHKTLVKAKDNDGKGSRKGYL